MFQSVDIRKSHSEITRAKHHKGDSGMPYAISKGLALALATAPLFVACGGSNADNPGPINTPQCSGASCGTQGAPAVGAGAGPLCPANADIVTSTYLGGAGSGEIVSLNIDAVNMKYTLKWLESPIPLVTGTVNPTPKATSIAGAVGTPPAARPPRPPQSPPQGHDDRGRSGAPARRHAAHRGTNALRVRADTGRRAGIGRIDVYDRRRVQPGESADHFHRPGRGRGRHFGRDRAVQRRDINR